MQLRADDFGCVPDGRVFESVAVLAGSTQMDVLEGMLRPSDVGKYISVPGATDLVAAVAELVRRKDCPASIDAGSNVLTAVLTQQDGFFQDTHKGLRITVAGAGQNGATLITDVADILGPTTLRLDQQAATSVALAETILNQPDQVKLADYARATADGVTFTISGRTVPAARMTLGDDLLASPVAAFSSEDLQENVTIPAAGHLVATIEAISGGNRISLSVPAHYTITDGSADVWSTDSRPGFEQLLDALSHLEVVNADIYFSAGVYDFTRAPAAAGSLPAALGLSGLRNAILRGAGQGLTVLRLMPGQDLKAADTHVVMARNCKGLTLRDLTVNGACLSLGSAGAQTHGIFLDDGCEDVVIERVEVFQTAGDAVRLKGELPAHEVRRVWVQGCRLVQNRRTGVAFQRCVEFAWIRDCYIETIPPSTQAGIDFEPSPPEGPPVLVAPRDIIIDSNVLVHGTAAVAVSLSGRAGDPAYRLQFTNNILQGGGMGGLEAHDVVVSGNTVFAGETGQVMQFRGSYDGLRIADNRIIAATGQRDAIHLSRYQGIAATGVRITGNNIDTTGAGISLDNPGSDVTIGGNRIQGTGQAAGILIELTGKGGEVHRDFRIAANNVTDFAGAGIQISTDHTTESIVGLEVCGNEVSAGANSGPGPLSGIRLVPGNGTGRWLERVLVTGNNIADDVTIKIERDKTTVPYVAISGNPGAVAVFEGDGAPDETVPAAAGSLFLRVDGPAGGIAYIKTSETGATSWVQLATVS